MTDTQSPADAEHGDTCQVSIDLLHRMVEHLEHCSDTWTPSDPLLADLRAMLDQAKPESP